ncbi:HlyD family secretion protein [Desulforhopalus singaporensis]|uniref:Membrane fusion protein, multidrug efflux system n=1 Tax=Desulforhopalus singaporensis TaxID=91360 RepID=A0A1H0KP47_9BACT|nr:HlyD family secretion protein [Desulforhopalus singaporensis]SDO57563.1 membrane fusion protein, multidrug efflux system [Desulforhopalus singaporensis]
MTDTRQEPDTSPRPRSGPSPGKKKSIRLFFLVLGPLVVVAVSLFFYLTGGRFVETDNAYVQADKVAVSAEVSGTIVEVMVAENASIKKGTPLLKIDDRSYTIALEQARASLQEAEAEITKLKAEYSQKVNELRLAESNIAYAKKEFGRLSNLDSNQAVAKAQLDDAEHNLALSRHRFKIIDTEMEQILAKLKGDPEIPIDRLPSYRLARATVEEAALNLEKTTVVAPFDGRVTKLPRVGKHVAPGMPIMALVADSGFWIEANLKETELTHVRADQKVSIEVDTYPDFEFTGTVQSISPGTGSEFSIIPAQNATGNWVKVVQRIPVRIVVDNYSGNRVLRSGMSTTVTIDTEYHRPLPGWISRRLTETGVLAGTLASSGKQ